MKSTENNRLLMTSIIVVSMQSNGKTSFRILFDMGIQFMIYLYVKSIINELNTHPNNSSIASIDGMIKHANMYTRH